MPARACAPTGLVTLTVGTHLGHYIRTTTDSFYQSGSVDEFTQASERFRQGEARGQQRQARSLRGRTSGRSCRTFTGPSLRAVYPRLCWSRAACGKRLGRARPAGARRVTATGQACGDGCAAPLARLQLMKASIRARLRRLPDAEPMTALRALRHVEYATQSAACRHARQALGTGHTWHELRALAGHAAAGHELAAARR